MPKKRNTIWSRNKKEKQIITTRLIEISLKVDDHIYKHKSISECEAEQYIREVISYKIQCSRDERSLQVIEKLTRCMKAIINDHHELNTDVGNENNGSFISNGGDRPGAISPVYSIPDEDRTHLTQINEEKDKNVTEANNDVEIIDLCDIDDSFHNNTSIATIDTRFNVEVDIHRGISNLSLKDVEDSFDVRSNDTNDSQTILKNFEEQDMQLKTKNISSQGAVACGLLVNISDKGKTRKVQDKNIVCNTINDKLLSKTCIKNSVIFIEPNKTAKVKTNDAPNSDMLYSNTIGEFIQKAVVENKLPTNMTNTTISDTFCTAANNYIPDGQQQTCYDSNRKITINYSNHTLNNVNRQTQPTLIFKCANQRNGITAKDADNLTVNTPTNNFNGTQNVQNTDNASKPSREPLNNDKPFNNTSVIQENSTTKKKRAPRKKKTLDLNEKEIKPKTKRVYRAPKRDKENCFPDSGKNKGVPIYNKNVVNDLSWIENIRYVREIREDENAAELELEDSFWNNYYLPGNWDNEFD